MNELAKAGAFLLTYWVWLFLADLLGLSIITYGATSGGGALGMGGTTPRFNEIADLYFNNYWTVQGWAALLFFLFNFGLIVGRQAHWPELSRRNLLNRFFPLVLKTVMASVVWVMLTLWLTPSQFLGSGFPVEESFWSGFNCLVRGVAWLGWAVGEEWVFRKALLERVQKAIPQRFLAILIVTALWVLTRSWHQHLGMNQTLTLILAGLALGLHASHGGSYLQGAALLGGTTLAFQVLFSLPVLGHEFTGFWIIKYRSDSLPSLSNHLLHLVSGGAGGPFSSSVLQLGMIGWLVANSVGRPARRG
ncbi:MAG: type II CAAX prenyl endopeptidase Rce1 family protein [Oligoflexia bacterium]